jgi:hypothetical protein
VADDISGRRPVDRPGRSRFPWYSRTDIGLKAPSTLLHAFAEETVSQAAADHVPMCCRYPCIVVAVLPDNIRSAIKLYLHWPLPAV